MPIRYRCVRREENRDYTYDNNFFHHIVKINFNILSKRALAFRTCSIQLLSNTGSRVPAGCCRWWIYYIHCNVIHIYRVIRRTFLSTFYLISMRMLLSLLFLKTYLFVKGRDYIFKHLDCMCHLRSVQCWSKLIFLESLPPFLQHLF